MSKLRTIGIGVVAALVVAGVTTTAAAASPAASPPGPAWMVTVGDSAISGEAGRWAGNTNMSSWRHDTGADAYYDNASNTAETTAGCHRSKAAEAHIGDVNSLNLACSGARTYTQTGGDFKPGLDWYDGPAGKSQVVQLQEFAATNDVDAVTILIGANNFGFADIVQQCVTNWLTSPWWWKNYCNDDRSIKNRFTSSAVDARTNEVAGAIANVSQAMTNAGYTSDDYSVIIQTYWSPIPRGSDIRYSERGWTRQSIGGCGIWNRDANWANDTAVVKMNQALTDGVVRSGIDNYVVLDMSRSLDGHRLCEQGVGLLEEVGLGAWTDAGAADATEWVSQIRTVTTIFGPYQLQEGIHSSYWGQLAMRNCLRQAYNGGAVRGGTCTSTGGVNGNGEPNMALS
ncbi:MAG: hypothetical protein R8G01_18825 [Ilumatobacteraceae bacterium]|nr:hypothetical protein [Ilumatobacteraceae bacterium]